MAFFAQNTRLCWKRHLGSKKWIDRHASDKYVKQAQVQNYRSRAAFKLIEINQKFKLFKKGQTVVDLGATPGSWSQVAQRVCSEKSQIIAVDMLQMNPIDGVNFIKGDFTDARIVERVREILQGPVDIVLSDMAPSFSGQFFVDHENGIELAETALEFAEKNLRVGGSFVVKITRGGLEKEFTTAVSDLFQKTKTFKPDSSRQESSEIYVVATQFRGPTKS